MATIRDVAKLANTSISSVSKVLRNSEIRISDKKRQEILDAAAKLNYIPNNSASTLKLGRSDTVAVIAPDLADPFYPKLAKSLMLELEKIGQKCMVFDYDRCSERAIDIMQSLRDGSVNSILLIPAGELLIKYYIDKIRKLSEEMGVKVIMVNPGKKIDGIPTSTFDAYSGGRKIAEYVLSQGHRKLGIVSNQSNPFYRGFRSVVDSTADTEIFIEDSARRYDGGFEAGSRLLSTGVTCICCSTDQLAIGVMSYAMQNGIAIPENIAVTGVNDMIPGRIFPVPLTTIRYSTPKLAEETIGMLKKLLDGGEAEDVILEPELLRRVSA
ncbi:MAG: LacI family DNA-binding transcriptional regulator [Oscillospiraceae bacterium]